MLIKNNSLSFLIFELKFYLTNYYSEINDYYQERYWLSRKFFWLSPWGLRDPDEKNRPLGKIFIKLQKLRNDLGLKCILIPGFAFKSISIINIEQDEFQTLLQKFGPENYNNSSFGAHSFCLFCSPSSIKPAIAWVSPPINNQS